MGRRPHLAPRPERSDDSCLPLAACPLPMGPSVHFALQRLSRIDEAAAR
jgi:hypothetical protein